MNKIDLHHQYPHPSLLNLSHLHLDYQILLRVLHLRFILLRLHIFLYNFHYQCHRWHLPLHFLIQFPHYRFNPQFLQHHLYFHQNPPSFHYLFLHLYLLIEDHHLNLKYCVFVAYMKSYFIESYFAQVVRYFSYRKARFIGIQSF